MLSLLPRHLLPFLLGGLLSGSALGQQARRWTDAEVTPLGRSVGAYLEARAAGTGIEKAKAEVTKSLVTLRTIPGEDGSVAGIDPLASTLDIQRALGLGRDLSKVAVQKGKVAQEVYTNCNLEGTGLSYAYSLPKDYDPQARGYPLLLAIPDENETPAEHLRAHWTAREILDQAILVAVQMPKNQAEWVRVSVNGRPGGLSYVMTGLRMATERFALDYDRIYVVGRGKGVQAALAAGDYSPHRFAGILGRAGDASELGPQNFQNLPTYFVGGGARVAAFQEAARAMGHDNCTVERAGGDKELWTWITKHPRKAYPTTATVVPGDPFPTRAHWVRVAPSALKPRATATLERAANKIVVQAEGVSHVTLYLNDVMLDLDQPVHVVCNGVERTYSVRRSVQEFLDLLLEGTNEGGACYAAQVIVPTSADAVEPIAAPPPAKDPEFERLLSESADNVEKLFELSLWCKSTQRDGQAARVLRRLLRFDPDHARAREALGHHFAKGQWFTTQAAFERFQRSQDPRAAAAKGHVEFKSLWMHPEERALAGKGWVKEQETGLWITPADRKRLTEGWARQDLEWIAPVETNFLDDGLWRVDGEWIDARTADQRHARLDAMWRIPTADVLLHGTTDRATCQASLGHMSRAMDDLRKVFGAEPPLPLSVALLCDEAQYDRFAFGDHDGRRRATHFGRLHTVHHAFFAESWYTRNEGRLEFTGMGVGYWDALAPGGNLYGVHAARLAAGLSYVDALDPSPKTIRQAISAGGPLPAGYGAYETEKLLPAWLRWGAAVYAERFFHDDQVAAGGDPWWARKWSLENLERKGGLRPLAEVFAFKLDPDQRDASQRLLIEAGLLVSFLVDGGSAPVTAAHGEFKASMLSGKPHPKYVKALTDALTAHEAELRAYAKP
ncbi:MAG: hypothetical protein IPK67_21080 [Planctomycetes bacterium]|nr:hypothetical protein [Planctomycetota bacterium]